MDITGTKKKIERAIKVAEQSYRKMNELLERVQEMEQALETTSRQVDDMEREMAEQRALLDAIATEQGLDAESVVDEADLPETPDAEEAAPATGGSAADED